MVVRVAAINYLNTIPFVYGLENSSVREQIELTFCTPSQAADRLISNDIDLGIVPVATLFEHSSFKVVSDFCIASDNEVKSVLLCSGKRLEDISEILLDMDSRTSAMLVQVLSKNYWNIDPKFSQFNFTASELDTEASYLLIGDKALKRAGDFKYVYEIGRASCRERV